MSGGGDRSNVSIQEQVFLQPHESILLSGVVNKKGRRATSPYYTRFLVLTDTPRLVYLALPSMKVKGELLGLSPADLRDSSSSSGGGGAARGSAAVHLEVSHNGARLSVTCSGGGSGGSGGGAGTKNDHNSSSSKLCTYKFSVEEIPDAPGWAEALHEILSRRGVLVSSNVVAGW